VDGSLAAVTVIVAVVDIARVERLNHGEEETEAAAGAAAAAGGEEESASFLPGAGTVADRQRRADRVGSYACMGFCVVFFLPFLRLLWVLAGLDMLFHADPDAMALLSVEARPSGGACNATQFVFMFYYLQAVMWLVLGVAGVVALATVVAAVTFAVQSCQWCKRVGCCTAGKGDEGGCAGACCASCCSRAAQRRGGSGDVAGAASAAGPPSTLAAPVAPAASGGAAASIFAGVVAAPVGAGSGAGATASAGDAVSSSVAGGDTTASLVKRPVLVAGSA